VASLTRPGRNTLPAAGAAGIAIILFAYYALTWRSVAGFIAAMDVCPSLLCDFTSYYYPMGEAVFCTGLPVQGFLYSPFIAILLAVFPPMGLDASLFVWGILQVVFVVFYLLLFRRLVPAGLPIQLLFVALVLSSYPLLLNFMGGQVSVFMIVALMGALFLNGRGHRWAAAGLLAFAVSFKFYPIIFLAPFVARRDHRMVVLAAGACGALLDSFRESDWVVANPHSGYLPHVVLRLADATGHDAQDYLPLLRWIAYAVAAANLGLILLVEHARLRHAALWSFQLVFLTIPFVLKTSWPHDFVFLPLTQSLLAWRLLEGEKSSPGVGAWREGIRHWRGAVTFSLLVASIVISNIVFFNLLGDFHAYGSCGFLFWASLFLLLALYVELLPPALRGSGRIRRMRYVQGWGPR